MNFSQGLSLAVQVTSGTSVIIQQHRAAFFGAGANFVKKQPPDASGLRRYRQGKWMDIVSRAAGPAAGLCLEGFHQGGHLLALK